MKAGENLPTVDLAGVRAGYGSGEVLHGVDFCLAAGEFVGIIGPNGAGKSTLIRVMAGTLKPKGGTTSYPFLETGAGRRERARNLAVLFQDQVGPLNITVREMVELGRCPHFRPLQWRPSPRDRQSIDRALDRTGTSDLAERSFADLSGGERQRVLLALALAREPRVLLLDEPVQNLDIRYQVEIFEILSELNRKQKVAVAAVLHDVNLAAQYCSRLIFLRGGRIVAAGSPRELLREDILEDLFEIRVEVHRLGQSRAVVIPAGKLPG